MLQSIEIHLRPAGHRYKNVRKSAPDRICDSQTYLVQLVPLMFYHHIQDLSIQFKKKTQKTGIFKKPRRLFNTCSALKVFPESLKILLFVSHRCFYEHQF